MANELLSPDKMAEQLREKVTMKIRTAFVDLVSDEQWKAMTESALKSFTEKRLDGYRHSPAIEIPSIFEEMIHDVIKEVLRERIKKELTKDEYNPEYGSPWGSFGPAPGEAVKTIMAQLAPEMVRALFGQVAQDFVQRMQQNTFG